MSDNATPRQLTAFLPAPFLRDGQPIEEASAQSRAATEKYDRWIQSVPDELLHVPVAEGKWSPAEHADHAIRSAALFASLVDACAQGLPMPEPPMAYQWPDGRLVAPDLILPSPGKSGEVLRAELKAAQDALESAVRRVEALGKGSLPCVPTGIFPPMTAVQALVVAGGHYLHHAPELTRSTATCQD